MTDMNYTLADRSMSRSGNSDHPHRYHSV